VKSIYVITTEIQPKVTRAKHKPKIEEIANFVRANFVHVLKALKCCIIIPPKCTVIILSVKVYNKFKKMNVFDHCSSKSTNKISGPAMRTFIMKNFYPPETMLAFFSFFGLFFGGFKRNLFPKNTRKKQFNVIEHNSSL
jgi:hypothetical protein